MKIPLASAIKLLKEAAAIVFPNNGIVSFPNNGIVSFPNMNDGRAIISIMDGQHPVFDFLESDNQEVEVSGYDMFLIEEGGEKIQLILCSPMNVENMSKND